MALTLMAQAQEIKDDASVHVWIMNRNPVSIHGFELGVVNSVKKDFAGFQLGIISNTVGRECDGFQAALFYNDAQDELHGLQLGLVNHTGSLQGIQLGLLNFNDDTRYLGFFPFINAAF